MKRKIAVAAALAATLFAAACGSDSGNTGTPNANASVDGKGKTLKVWLMVDAQSGWKNVVDDANARFTQATGKPKARAPATSQALADTKRISSRGRARWSSARR